MPYADRINAYWTGFYTSRVALKGQSKDVGRFLQAMRTYLSLLLYRRESEYLINNKLKFLAALDVIEEAVGVV